MAEKIRKRLLSSEITGPAALPGLHYRIWSGNISSDALSGGRLNVRPLVHNGWLGAYGVWCIRVTTGGGISVSCSDVLRSLSTPHGNLKQHHQADHNPWLAYRSTTSFSKYAPKLLDRVITVVELKPQVDFATTHPLCRVTAPMVEHAEPKERHAKMRDAEFWFRDGNIVLVARDVDFRVYKGILADQSPVFDDMFSFPQPAPFTPPRLELASSSNTDACPFVHLSDSPEDLRHLLRVCIPKKGMFR